jgi:hypothetical protein
MRDLRKAAEMAIEALRFKNILNMCGRYSTVDPEKAALAEIALRQALAQPEWVGLTDEERADCLSSSAVQSAINIEAKLKEKNT